MKKKTITAIIAVGGLLATNGYYLNKVSAKERELSIKEKELESVQKTFEQKSFNYENSIDLEKIKAEFEAKGMKSTRQMEYFKAQTPVSNN